MSKFERDANQDTVGMKDFKRSEEVKISNHVEKLDHPSCKQPACLVYCMKYALKLANYLSTFLSRSTKSPVRPFVDPCSEISCTFFYRFRSARKSHHNQASRPACCFPLHSLVRSSPKKKNVAPRFWWGIF